MLEIQCFSRGTVAILGVMFLGDMTDVPWTGYLTSLTLAQSSPLATSSHCEKQNLTNGTTHPQQTLPLRHYWSWVRLCKCTGCSHWPMMLGKINMCNPWLTGLSYFKEPDVFLMTHMTYIQNISDDKTISSFGLFSSQIQTEHLPDACDWLCCNIMPVITANTCSPSYHVLSALLMLAHLILPVINGARR